MPERNGKGEILYSESLPLLWDGAEAGGVEAVREGLYLRFRVRCPARSGAVQEGTAVPARNGLWRVWLCGEDGEKRLGTLEPDDRVQKPADRMAAEELLAYGMPGNGTLSLDRRLSLRSLSPLGRLLRCEVRPASEDGGQSRKPAQSGKAERSGPDILPRQEGGVRLVYPTGGPFPLPELFCFARLGNVGGRECWVFAFDGAGHPIFD